MSSVISPLHMHCFEYNSISYIYTGARPLVQLKHLDLGEETQGLVTAWRNGALTERMTHFGGGGLNLQQVLLRFLGVVVMSFFIG